MAVTVHTVLDDRIAQYVNGMSADLLTDVTIKALGTFGECQVMAQPVARRCSFLH